VSDYIEVSDGLKRRVPPEIIKSNRLPEWQAHHQSSSNGLFSSICSYPTEDPYIGEVICPFYADFDCEENPDIARKETVAFVKKFINGYNIPEELISICFSGLKGFSVILSHNVFNAEASTNLPLIWKSISQEIAAKMKLKTIDIKIYERRRLWRLPNSRHQKSGLYKIPIDLGVLEKLNVSEIKALAANSEGCRSPEDNSRRF
jgi:hypothetical protein